MTLLTGETDVFSSAPASGRCAVVFLAKSQAWQAMAAELAGIERVLHELAREGWQLSIRKMFDPDAADEAFVIDTGFAHDIDFAGVFEAPTPSAAIEGTVRLEQAGWSRLFTTEWLLGPREFAVVNGADQTGGRPWAFLAFWEWNDAWSAATPDQRRAYDLECDVAFNGDLSLGVNIAGRHRLDWASHWHHLGIWEAPSLETIDAAMAGHERAADFMFTTSRHIVGRVIPFSALSIAKRSADGH